MNLFLLSQLLACGAFILDMLAFQFSRRVVSLILLACSTSLLTFHFWLLDETSASGIMTLAAFQPDAGRLRILTLVGSLFWLSSNILAGSPVAVAMEAAFMVSTLISYWRWVRKKPILNRTPY